MVFFFVVVVIPPLIPLTEKDISAIGVTPEPIKETEVDVGDDDNDILASGEPNAAPVVFKNKEKRLNVIIKISINLIRSFL